MTLARREAEPAARQELEHVVPRAEQFPLEGATAAHQIAHALPRLRRNPNRGELATPIQVRELLGIIAVVLPLMPGPDGNERWGDDLTGVPPRGKIALQNVPGSAGFVAGPDLARLGEPGKVLPQHLRVVREAIHACRGLRGRG